MGFFVIRPDQVVFEVDLIAVIRHYEEMCFKDSKPIALAEFVPDLDGDARVLPQIDKVEVHARYTASLKVCCILVLHELINNKLYKKYGAPQDYEGEIFQAELQRLWDLRAYANLL